MEDLRISSRVILKEMIQVFLRILRSEVNETAPVTGQSSASATILNEVTAPGNPTELRNMIQQAMNGLVPGGFAVVPGLDNRRGSGLEKARGQCQATEIKIQQWEGMEVFISNPCWFDEDNAADTYGSASSGKQKKRKKSSENYDVFLYQVAIPAGGLVQLQNDVNGLKRAHREGADESGILHKLEAHLPSPYNIVSRMLQYCEVQTGVGDDKIAEACNRLKLQYRPQRSQTKSPGRWILSHVSCVVVFAKGLSDTMGGINRMVSSSAAPSASSSGMQSFSSTAALTTRQHSTAVSVETLRPAHVPALTSSLPVAHPPMQQPHLQAILAETLRNLLQEQPPVFGTQDSEVRGEVMPGLFSNQGSGAAAPPLALPLIPIVPTLGMSAWPTGVDDAYSVGNQQAAQDGSSMLPQPILPTLGWSAPVPSTSGLPALSNIPNTYVTGLQQRKLQPDVMLPVLQAVGGIPLDAPAPVSAALPGALQSGRVQPYPMPGAPAAAGYPLQAMALSGMATPGQRSVFGQHSHVGPRLSQPSHSQLGWQQWGHNLPQPSTDAVVADVAQAAAVLTGVPAGEISITGIDVPAGRGPMFSSNVGVAPPHQSYIQGAMVSELLPTETTGSAPVAAVPGHDEYGNLQPAAQQTAAGLGNQEAALDLPAEYIDSQDSLQAALRAFIPSSQSS